MWDHPADGHDPRFDGDPADHGAGRCADHPVPRLRSDSIFTAHNMLNDPKITAEEGFLGTLPFIGVMPGVLVAIASCRL
jgi:hypothetical protein